MSKSVLMLGICSLVVAIMLVGLASAIAPVSAQPSDSEDDLGINIETEFVDLTVDSNYYVDVEVRTPNFNISFTDINPESGVEDVEADSDSLGEQEADAAQTGLCAVGLGSEDSPLPFGVKDNGDINSEAEPHGSPDTQTTDDVLAECTEHGETTPTP